MENYYSLLPESSLQLWFIDLNIPCPKTLKTMQTAIFCNILTSLILKRAM